MKGTKMALIHFNMYIIKEMSALKKISQLIKKIDVFALDVNFKYDRKYKFKTVLGGLITLLATIGIMSFFLVLV